MLFKITKVVESTNRVNIDRKKKEQISKLWAVPTLREEEPETKYEGTTESS